MSLHIRLLGDCSLSYGETPVTGVNSARMQPLLAHLLLHRDTHQPRAHLAFLLWPDSPKTQTPAKSRNLLCRLRRALPEINDLDTMAISMAARSDFSRESAEGLSL